MAEAAPSLKLIVGLGNPGAEYARTRHNAGWWLVDALAEQHHAVWRTDRRRHLMVSQIRAPHREPWLIKPTSFMNRSGAPVAEFTAFYRISPAEILVVHDEIDLPPGTARLKYGGGHGGHNGVRDVMAYIGPDFWRLRLGVQGIPGAEGPGDRCGARSADARRASGDRCCIGACARGDARATRRRNTTRHSPLAQRQPEEFPLPSSPAAS